MSELKAIAQPDGAASTPDSMGNVVAPAARADAPGDRTVLSSLKPHSSIKSITDGVFAGDLAGEMLLHFRLDDYIGVGGMGAVFRATDIRLDRPVALKILPSEQASDLSVIARFQHEARAAARLDHENIARVYFVGEDRGLQFIAFEFVDGVNVRDLIQQCGPLPAAAVVNYAIQIAGALVHAAARKVVHRDIKPSNIIITPTGRVKLVDMGLARSFERRHDGGLTQSGITLGTFDYISPEQARDPRSADTRSDIYSLGCTLFHMLTGRPPYPEGTVLQKLLKHQGDSPPDVRQLNHRVPANLAALVARMMAKDPQRRYQSPEELLSDLLELADAMGLKSTSPEGLIWMSEPVRGSMSPAAWGVWISAVAALLLVIWVLYGRPDSPDAKSVVAAGGNAQRTSEDGVNRDSADGVTLDGDSSSARNPDLAQSSHAEMAGSSRDSSPLRAGPDATHAAAPAPIISVTTDDELLAALDTAPTGSIIELSGVFRPQAAHPVDLAGIRLENKRLTLRAADGADARVQMDYDVADVVVADWTLFRLAGCQITFEGIQFELNPAEARVPMLLFAAQSSSVVCRRCAFFEVAARVATGGDGNAPLAWIAHLDGGVDVNGRVSTSKFAARECFFGGGDGAFLLDGPTGLDLRDSVVLPYRTTVAVSASGAPESHRAEIDLTQVSLFARGEPVFDLRAARASIRATNVVVSHLAPSGGALTRIDADSKLAWNGNGNVYHGIEDYVVARAGRDTTPVAHSLTDWFEFGRGDVTEEDATEADAFPWQITLDEAALKAADDPSAADAFRLKRDWLDRVGQPPGARVAWPWGPLYPVSQLDRTAIGQLGRGAVGASRVTSKRGANDNAGSTTDRSTSADASGSVSSVRMPDIKKMLNPGDSANPGGTGAQPAAVDSSGGAVGVLVVDPQNRGAFHSLAAACAKAEDGAVIEIRHAGRLREPPIEVGDKHITIRAASGVRPIIELAADRLELGGREPRLLSIRRGGLVLRDLDIVLTADAAAGAESWAVVASRGADVSLEGCTVSVDAPQGVMTTLVRFLAGDPDEPMMPTTAMPANRPQVQFKNSMLVGMVHAVRLQSGTLLRAEFENCAVETHDAVLVVATGAERAVPGAANELEFRHCTIKTERQLVSYEASESRPWLPRLEVNSLDTLFVSDPATAFVRFRSPRPADELRGLLHWKGVSNSYDQVETFWSIESTGSTASAEQHEWTAWLTSPARDESRADRIHVRFVEPPDSGPVAKRTRKHFMPDPDSALMAMASDGGTRGADLKQLPASPQERDAE